MMARTFDDVRKVAPRLARMMQKLTGENIQFAILLWDAKSTRACWIHDSGTDEQLIPKLQNTIQAVKDEIGHRLRGIN